MKIPALIVISTFSLISIGSTCNVASWSYGRSSFYYDEFNSGPQTGFGYSPGFFGYTGGFGLGSLGLLLAMLMSHRHRPPPQVVHHHHHHYYREKPGGSFEYQYKNEGPKWDKGSYGPGDPSEGPQARGPFKSSGPFSNFFKNMFNRR